MSNIKLFEHKKIRSHWDAQQEKWYFSIVDIIEVLTESSIPKRYWTDLKKKLTMEASQLYENIVNSNLKQLMVKNTLQIALIHRICSVLSNLSPHPKPSLLNNGWQKQDMKE